MRQSGSESSDGTGLRVGLVVSRYHTAIVNAMEEAAKATFLGAGGCAEDLLVVDAPGSFELVVISSALAKRPDVDAVVALGCVIRGETSHDRWINSAVSHGLADIAVATGKPVSFGVLTCDNMEQAQARSGGQVGNKGEEAMQAALSAVLAIRGIQEGADAGPGVVQP